VVVVDIDAEAIGSPLDPVLTLFAPDGVTLLAEDDDTDGLDSFIMYELPDDGRYVLRVRSFDHPCCGGNDHVYWLLIVVQTGGPTPTPTKQPHPGDTDGDGCSDQQENGPSAVLGGQRDFLNFWDFLDVPTGGGLSRDGAVTAADIAAIVSRFGSNDTGAGPFNRASNPLSTPNAAVTPPGSRQNYHPAYDRGGPAPGGPAWDLLPADGAIAAGDIAAAIAQFGHACS
jgi:hypothetical protein